jgi:hypothetical protein
VTLKVVPKAACDFENCSYVRWRNSTNESEGKPEQKFDQAYRTIVRNSICLVSNLF